MVRAIWKGAISFGLVHIPVSLSTAVHAEGVDFDWLDKRSMDPVGYKRVNKVTGKEIDKSQIVKGVEYEKGRYVVISEEEIRTALDAKACQCNDSVKMHFEEVLRGVYPTEEAAGTVN